jgi:parvulin-like peptidyl-prolyl cis-trans isomerase-like protein
MKRNFFGALLSLALLAPVFVPPLRAQAPYDADQVLLENRWARVTRGDYETELTRLPPDIRGGFAANNKRVYELLTRLLTTKTLAAQARAANLDKDPALQNRLALEMDRVQAGLQIAKLDEAAARAFDARRAQFDASAREIYLTRRDSYRVPEQVAVSHILFDTKKQSKEEALKLAQETRSKILAGADFNEVAKQSSDDPSGLLQSLTRFLGERLKLMVNVSKSAVARPWQRKFLGYSVTWHQEPKLNWGWCRCSIRCSAFSGFMNRRMRNRMYGGVEGDRGDPVPYPI